MLWVPETIPVSLQAMLDPSESEKLAVIGHLKGDDDDENEEEEETKDASIQRLDGFRHWLSSTREIA